MKQEDVLELFRNEAKKLGRIEPTQSNIILTLAQILSDSKERLPDTAFQQLVHIGAAMYQAGLSNYRAQSEVGETMRTSLLPPENKKK